MATVIPLGTNSAIPTKRRHPSATAVVLGGRWILFDCGEGTQLRLLRAGLRPSHLDAIFISHLHGDHVYGLFGLLSTLSMQNRTVPLVVFGPVGLGELVKSVVRYSALHLTYHVDVREFYSGVVLRNERYIVRTLPLRHTVATQAYSITERERPGRFDPDRARALGVDRGPDFKRLQLGHSVRAGDGRLVSANQIMGPPRPGVKITYCTDTRPSLNAVELAFGSDLLIHEATYTEDLAREARERGHSTATEAAMVAREAKAHKLMITHFSSRYDDPTSLVHEARRIFPETLPALELVPVTVEPGMQEISREEPKILTQVAA